MRLNKILVVLVAVVFLSTTVLAQSVTREVPSAVNAGSSFQVTYETQDAPLGRWFVLIDDGVSGGCSPTSTQQFMLGTGGSGSETVTFTAPSSGSCTFSGIYQYAGDSEENLGSQTVTISGTGAGTGDDEDFPIIWVIGAVVVVVLILALKKKR